MNSDNTMMNTLGGIVFTIALATTTPSIQAISCDNYMLSNNVNMEFNNTATVIPKEYTSKNKSNYENAINLFQGEMRDFTEQESMEYEKSLSNIYKPMGVNIFDLC